MSSQKIPVKRSRFPVSLLVIFFLVLLLISGIHFGLIVLANEQNWSELVQTIIPMIYWFLVALGLTLFTGWRVRRSYEIPMQNLAKATSKVAHGDFSVYVPTTNGGGRRGTACYCVDKPLVKCHEVHARRRYSNTNANF